MFDGTAGLVRETHLSHAEQPPEALKLLYHSPSSLMSAETVDVLNIV
jgi:hypothetical protein